MGGDGGNMGFMGQPPPNWGMPPPYGQSQDGSNMDVQENKPAQEKPQEAHKKESEQPQQAKVAAIFL